MRGRKHQETRYELVEGALVEMMAGASRIHGVSVTNLIATLKPQLRGGN